MDEHPDEQGMSFECWELWQFIQDKRYPLELRDQWVERLEQMAEQGDTHAQFAMGQFCRDGPLLIPDSQKAKRLPAARGDALCHPATAPLEPGLPGELPACHRPRHHPDRPQALAPAPGEAHRPGPQAGRPPRAGLGRHGHGVVRVSKPASQIKESPPTKTGGLALVRRRKRLEGLLHGWAGSSLCQFH